MIIVIADGRVAKCKSYLAQNLAAFCSYQQNQHVLLVDSCPQRSSSEWLTLLNQSEMFSHITGTKLQGAIRNQLLDIEFAHDLVIVDCCEHDVKAMQAAMSIAHSILLLIAPEQEQLPMLPQLADLLSTSRLVNPQLQCFLMLQQPISPQDESAADHAIQIFDNKNDADLVFIHYANEHLLNPSKLNQDPNQELGEYDVADEVAVIARMLLSSDHPL